MKEEHKMIKKPYQNPQKTDGAIIRKLFRSSVTSIIIAAVAAMFGMLIDGIIIGKFLGTESMAAYGIVSPLFSIMTAISGILAAGSQVFCAKYLGAGEVKRAREVFSVCMVATTVIAAVVIAGVVVFCRPICVAMGAKGDAAALLPLAADYLYGIAAGIFPVLLLFIFNSLMRLDGDPNRVIWAVVVMTVFDIAGDLLNVFVFRGGMLGMGISTAISYYAALFVLLLHFRKPDIIFKFNMKDISMKDLLGILQTGAPTASGSICAMIRNTILNLIMVYVAGSTAVAALSVRNTLNTLFGSILLGVAQTTTMIAGMVYGEEDRTSARELMKVSLQYALGIGLILAVFVFIASPWTVSLFAGSSENGAEMTALAVQAMKIYAFGLPLYGINMVFVNYLQGINRGFLANIVTILDNLIFVVFIALALMNPLKENAVWVSYPVGEVLVLFAIFMITLRMEGKVPKKVDDYLFLSDTFGAAKEDVYECSMQSVGDVMKAVEEVGEFMKRHNAPPKKQMLIPLCMEEMAKNVIEHGFTKDKKTHSVEVRVLQKDEDWILRIRDNCIAFNPKQWMEIHHPEDPASNIGIRMVYGMAKDVQHINAMQLNNLTIRV